ncbi:Na+/H+ antiporter NhaC family protein [Clostridium sp. P21]|uniref:Na+/H+ antiporter NhaC family protein n=1 Tax=Clostridium muellerianum TaxID=2716538 RepID=A0A7Y0HQ48_9CLOT|nr:Na+/H+ antiporter NhaC family protein [Clostridium muellerianum]NMM63378.1 Na+/H+ antiporter NhaC family protein [Clostridium muellerianum]
MNEKRSEKNYGAKALLPLLVFLGLYVGCGIVFTVLKTKNPFTIMSRYVAILIAILVAIICFDRKKTISEKIDLYCENAGQPGVMQLGLMVLMAGGFASVCTAIGGEKSIVNLGISLIPSYFLVPGIFAICAIISTCIGTSMGTMATMIPVTVALAKGAGLNPGMAGAAVITGAYFGDNLSMIAATTICAVRGAGADMKEKFQTNFLIALPATIITIVAYGVFSMGSGSTAVKAGSYNILTIIPYISTLVFALLGLNVILVLAIGIGSAGIIGITIGTTTFFGWAKALSSGMESMFWLAVFAMMISGLAGLVRYYGGIEWLVKVATNKIKGRKSCEYIIGLLSLVLSATIVNNVMAIIIAAPVAKELGDKYKVASKKMATLLDIGACVAVMIVPHGAGAMMVQVALGCTYLEVIKYQFYPLFLILSTAITIQLGLMGVKKKEENLDIDSGNKEIS